MYVAYARDTFFIGYGHATIRWHMLVYVVIRRTCPKILCMHKISNVCRRIDYTLRPFHTLPDSANGRVTDNKILCPFVSVHMRFLSVTHAVNAFRVR